MDLKGLDKLPRNAQKILPGYIDGIFSSYGEGIVSVFAYGSVTGSDYSPATSDVNIAVVVEDNSFGRIAPVLRTIKRGQKQKITAPLFLTTSYIKMSLDTFPIEFMGMKDTRQVLYGEDVLSDVEFDREDLRRECEYQLKGKLLTLRQAFLEQGLARKGMERLIKSSLSALIPAFRAVLRVQNGSSPSTVKVEVLRELSDEFGIDVSSFLEVLRDKQMDGHIAGKSAEEFLNDFLIQLERLSEIVDDM